MFPVKQRVPPKPKEKKNKCEILIEKTARGIRKRISPECTPQQIKALSEQKDFEED